MKFENSLFISYAHIDNQPLTPGEQGWITRFHASLETFLSMRVGGEVQIWRDDKLQGNDVFADEIVDQFVRTAVLVSVLTPRYLDSEWCTREVAEFCKCAERTGGVVVGNESRIFKVLKAPVDTEESLPAVLQNMLGYEFFTFEDNVPLEMDAAYGEKFAHSYNRKVGMLAWDISQLLKKLRAEIRDNGDTGSDEPAAAAPTIYLAECSYDCKESREVLEGELRRHGYSIVPDRDLPRDEEGYIAAVDLLLERSALAIHLVGTAGGVVPDGPSGKSVVELQNELAVRRSKGGALPRLIWLHEGTSSSQQQHQAFIDRLHNDAEAQFGADLITADLEVLKTLIHATLKKPLESEPEQPNGQSAEDSAKLIYLICDERDRKATVPLRKYLREQGFDVSLPAFEGDANVVRKAHQGLIATCEAVIVFYGAGDEGWKRTIDNELKKMPGYRGGKPLLGRCTYLADPVTSDKEDLIDMDEPNLINGMGRTADAEMEEFIRAMSLGGAAS